MKFTPYGIKSQEFTKSVMGYDKDEVKAYLEKLADEFEKLAEENSKLNEELGELKERMEDYKQIEKNFQESLLSAQEAANRAIEDAKKQTAIMIKEAELKAKQIVDKAQEEAQFIREGVFHLKEEKELLVAKLKAIINSQLELLDVKLSEKEIEIPKDEELQEKENPDSKDDGEMDVDDIVEKLI